MASDTTIPCQAAEFLLPRPTLSIVEFLCFSLLLIPSLVMVNDAQQYLCAEEQTCDDVDIVKHLPCPSASIIRDLANLIKTTSGKSIQCAHLTACAGQWFPLWIVMFWSQVVHLHSICQHWVAGMAGLKWQNHFQRWKSKADVAHCN